MHGALDGVNLWRERHGQLRVEQLQSLLLGRQAEDLVLEPLVLLLQGVQRLEHLHNWGDKRTHHTSVQCFPPSSRRDDCR